MKDEKIKTKNKSYFNSDLFLTMEESHIEWAVYSLDSRDYYVSLNQETLGKIKNWDIIRSKIVYDSDNDMTELVQKELYISLMSDNERRKNWFETKIVRTEEKVWLRISTQLLDILLRKPWKDYEYRYDFWWNKIHFYLSNDREPLSEKRWFDNIFKNCEALNKPTPQPEMWDLFESEYIDVYNKPE